MYNSGTYLTHKVYRDHILPEIKASDAICGDATDILVERFPGYQRAKAGGSLYCVFFLGR